MQHVDYADFDDQQCAMCKQVFTAKQWWTTWECLRPCNRINCGFLGKDVCPDCAHGLGPHEGMLHDPFCFMRGEYESTLSV